MNETPKRTRIIIAYDGSTGADAALEDLRRAGLPDTVDAVVLTVADVWPPSNGDPDRAAVTEPVPAAVRMARAQAASAVAEARSQAERAAERLRALHPTWNVEAEARADSPAWAIIKKADEWNADLVVVGSQGRSALSRLILGSVSQKVLSEARCPVRIGRRSNRSDTPPRIVIGVDGSPGAAAAIRTVAQRRWPQGTQVRVVSVDDDALATGRRDDGRVSARTMAEGAVDDLRRRGLTVTLVLDQGDPKKRLVEEAAAFQADCIFAGARGQGGLGQLLLGSVASAVAANAPCSVEIAR